MLDGNPSVAWGTQKNAYAMYGWACSGCNMGELRRRADAGRHHLHYAERSERAQHGANHLAVTSDGTHNMFVGMMWKAGMWRYVEP